MALLKFNSEHEFVAEEWFGIELAPFPFLPSIIVVETGVEAVTLVTQNQIRLPACRERAAFMLSLNFFVW